MDLKVEKRGRFLIQEIDCDEFSEAENETMLFKRLPSNEVQRCNSSNFHVYKFFYNESDLLGKDKENVKCEIYDSQKKKYVDFSMVWGELAYENAQIESELEGLFKYELINKKSDNKLEGNIDKGIFSDSTFHDSSNDYSNDCSALEQGTNSKSRLNEVSIISHVDY